MENTGRRSCNGVLITCDEFWSRNVSKSSKFNDENELLSPVFSHADVKDDELFSPAFSRSDVNDDADGRLTNFLRVSLSFRRR